MINNLHKLLAFDKKFERLSILNILRLHQVMYVVDVANGELIYSDILDQPECVSMKNWFKYYYQLARTMELIAASGVPNGKYRTLTVTKRGYEFMAMLERDS